MAGAASHQQQNDAYKRMLNWQRSMDRDPYLSIADALKVPGVKVCIFAVVAEIGANLKSEGTDFYVRLRIADDSHKAGLSATFFAADTTLLPNVRSNGDVICLQDVEVQQYYKDSFFVKFCKWSSSFALFGSKVSAECSPYHALRYAPRKHDKEHLTRMRTWLPNNPLGLKDLELQLRSLKSDSTFDLVCKVLHVFEDSGKWIFCVWDGTDTPAAEFPAISDAEAIESMPLLGGPPLSREDLCKMPCVGTVLRIFSNKKIKEVSHMQNDIYWARFCNITCKNEFGIWKGVFLDSTRVRLLSHKDGSVVDRLKMYASRSASASKVHHQPIESFVSNVAEVEYKGKVYSTLMESLTQGQETHKVKTLVRVVGVCPYQASELPLLSTGEHCIRLTLEDPTARIHAYVHPDELVTFFGGFLTAEVIKKKMNKLLGVPEPEDSEEVASLNRNPPWIRCCLKCYYLDEKDHWGSRRYQIFKTMIRD